MTEMENLHYALGELAYAVAFADGRVQKEERQKFHELVSAGLKEKDYGFDVAEIIFQVLEKDRPDVQTAYDWAIKQLKLYSHYLSPEFKVKIKSVMEKIAAAYPPVTL